MANYDALPPGVTPLAVGMESAAALLSVSANHFNKLIVQRVMPQGRLVGGRVLWDVEEVRAAFRAMPRRGESAKGNGWDDVV